MRKFRVEARYPEPSDRALQVTEFDTKEEAIGFANRMVDLANRMKANGYPPERVNGQVGVYEVEKYETPTIEWYELIPVKNWREEKPNGEEGPPQGDPRPWRR